MTPIIMMNGYIYQPKQVHYWYQFSKNNLHLNVYRNLPVSQVTKKAKKIL